MSWYFSGMPYTHEFQTYARHCVDQSLLLPDKKTGLISEAVWNVHMALQAPSDMVALSKPWVIKRRDIKLFNTFFSLLSGLHRHHR